MYINALIQVYVQTIYIGTSVNPQPNNEKSLLPKYVLTISFLRMALNSVVNTEYRSNIIYSKTFRTKSS